MSSNSHPRVCVFTPGIALPSCHRPGGFLGGGVLLNYHVSPMTSFRPYLNPHTRRWQTIVELGRDEAGKRKQIFRTVAKERNTKAEAKRVGRLLVNEMEAGTYAEPTDLTVAELLETWLADVARHQVSGRSQDRYGSIVRIHLVPALGGVKLTALRLDHIQCCYSGLIDKGLAPATVHKTHALLHSALKHAVRMRLLARNPSDDASLPKIRRPEMTALSEEQVGELLRAAEGTPRGRPAARARHPRGASRRAARPQLGTTSTWRRVGSQCAVPWRSPRPGSPSRSRRRPVGRAPSPCRRSRSRPCASSTRRRARCACAWGRASTGGSSSSPEPTVSPGGPRLLRAGLPAGLHEGRPPVSAARSTAHPCHDAPASGRAPQGRPGASRTRQRRHHPGRLLARGAAHAGGGGSGDRCGAEGGTRGIGRRGTPLSQAGLFAGGWTTGLGRYGEHGAVGSGAQRIVGSGDSVAGVSGPPDAEDAGDAAGLLDARLVGRRDSSLPPQGLCCSAHASASSSLRSTTRFPRMASQMQSL